MSKLKKILGWFVGIVLTLAALIIICVGPWPTYSDSKFEKQGYYAESLKAIDASATESEITDKPGRLSAGWGERSIVTTIGTPLAGFGDRQGKPSTGVNDENHVKALALSDGRDTVVLVGSDMLIVPNNIADLVRAAVAKETSLTASDILFNASHTHCGPGAWGPGILAKGFSGTFDEKIVTFLAEQFSAAIIDAYKAMQPAKAAFGSIDAPEYIRNRTREAGVDSELSYMLVEQDDGDRCFLVSYSAHPTVLGGKVMVFSADYPGFLQRSIESEHKSEVVYLGGAVGSMGPKAPDNEDPFMRAQLMGEALAKLVVDDAQAPVFETNLDIVSAGGPITIPPIQLRVSNRWRISPIAVNFAGVDRGAWIHGARVVKTVFMGMPCDFSGEISTDMKKWAETEGLDLWNLSFCADYVGYVSPDRYYGEVREPEGDLAYETGFMSWTGPNQEAFFTSLIKHTVGVMGKPAPTPPTEAPATESPVPVPAPAESAP